jgi:cell volume regulation protein A
VAPVATLFLAVAAVTFLGVAAGRIFQATRVPDIPLLLALGLLLGPLNREAVARGHGVPSLAEFLDPGVLQPMAPYVAGLALIVILFESGLKLDVVEFAQSIRPAFLHTLPTMVLTVVLIGLVGRYVLGMPILVAAVLAVALSNVGQTVSAAVIHQMSIPESVRSIYFVEMALYDLISIPILVGLLTLGEGAADPSAAFSGFAQTLSLSLLVGSIFGLVWMFALRRLTGHPNSYMLSLAALLVLYGVSEVLGASGAVAVLLFGLVIGNRKAILAWMTGARARPSDTDPRVQEFHGEVAFFVRTFFFLFLGINFSTGADSEGGLADGRWLGYEVPGNAVFVAGVAAIIAAIVCARYAAVRLVSARGRPERRDLFPVFGRGLGTAVLATLPFLRPGYVPRTPYYATFQPWEAVFLNTALLVVLVTVLLSSFFVWLRELGAVRPTRLSAGAKAPARPRPREPERPAP